MLNLVQWWVAGCASQLVSWQLPPAMPFNLCCAILGQNTAFLLEIDKTQMVDQLKKRIKAENAHALASYDADSLVLYKVNIKISSEEAFAQVMGKISQNTTYTEEIQVLSTKPKHVLTNPTFKLSRYFKKRDVTKETIHILVEPPPGESINSIDPRAWS